MNSEATRHFRAFLDALGLTPEIDAELERTPQRFATMMAEMSAGISAAPPVLSVFGVTSANHEAHSGPIVLLGLPFSSLCVHHLVPFFGTIDVAYVADEQMVGFGSIGRVIDHFAARPQVQERLVAEIADYLASHLKPRGLLVRCRARQLCMELRGAKKRGTLVSFAARGSLCEGELRQELIAQFSSAQQPL
ncbi:MAG: GTP cyclohydrolase I [Bradymonadaceae bacterium]|nr:GTP cyclohydrolase I [Lujinxingiaceae bacterium]